MKHAKDLVHRLKEKTPVVMGILNVTPDSFYDNGRFNNLEKAIKQAKQMIKDGAEIIDVGGESTRPGAPLISLEEEYQRVIPVLEALVNEDVWVSIDTSQSTIMHEACALGVSMLNDIRSFSAPATIDVLLEYPDILACIMHITEPYFGHTEFTQPTSMESIQNFFKQKIQQMNKAGIDRKRFIIDPGFGFGKAPDDNWSILKHLRMLESHNQPILVGLSNKSMFKHALNLNIEERLHATVAANLLAVEQGAKIIRVHDVKPHYHAIKVWEALNNAT